MTTPRDQARKAKSVAHREMRRAAATDIIARRKSLAEALAEARDGEHAIVETTDLTQLAAVVLVRSMHQLDEFVHDLEQEPAFRANCARANGELALKLAEHIANHRQADEGRVVDAEANVLDKQEAVHLLRERLKLQAVR